MRPGGDALGGVTPKRWTAGTHRARTPRQTLDAVAPLLQDCGVTRVADVTGLDRIGIPVVMVVRPNGRTLSVVQGKGVTADAARASGVMEAIETHYAEHHRLRVEVGDLSDLGPGACVDPLRLPLRARAAWTPTTAVPWVEGVDLVRRAQTWVPLERVAVDYALPRAPGLGVFVQDSNGLASGNCLAEAMLHALLELVERDARALAAPSLGRVEVRRAIDPVSADDAIVDDLVTRCVAAGMALDLFDLTTDVGVPVVEAVLAERRWGALPPLPPLRGYGCHLDSRVAVARAITEAAQARLTVIAGSRDDLTAAHYPAEADGRRRRRRWAAAPERDLVALRPGRAGSTIEADLRSVLDALVSRGIDQVVAVDLSPPGGRVAVVRLVVPGLEGYAGRRGYTPGVRARSAAGAAVAT